MKKLIATTCTVGLLMTGVGMSQAYAEGQVTARYGCNEATFTNGTSQTVNVNYGTASSGDVTSVRIRAGKSVTVGSRSKNFGYTATTQDGIQVGIREWPGVDLTAKCGATSKPTKSTSAKPTKSTSAKPTKSTSAKPTKTTKPTAKATKSTQSTDKKGGLAKTGV